MPSELGKETKPSQKISFKFLKLQRTTNMHEKSSQSQSNSYRRISIHQQLIETPQQEFDYGWSFISHLTKLPIANVSNWQLCAESKCFHLISKDREMW